MTDCLAQMDGEPAKLSESELKAIIWFESKSTWRDYAFHAAMMRHANEIWVKEIEAEKLRVYAFYLHVTYQLQLIVLDVDMPKEKNAKRFEILKKSTADLHEAIEGLYAYRDAIPKLEAILYGMPFFGEKLAGVHHGPFRPGANTARHYDESIREFCKCHDAKKFIGPIVKDMESYLVKDAVPSEAASDEPVDYIKHLAEIEMQARD